VISNNSVPALPKRYLSQEKSERLSNRNYDVVAYGILSMIYLEASGGGRNRLGETRMEDT